MVIESVPNQSNDAEPQQRICLACKHFYYDSGWPGTDQTGGSNAEASCGLHRWELSGSWRSGTELFELNMMAKTCPDYGLSDLARKHGFTE